jgi:hypothetical protein
MAQARTAWAQKLGMFETAPGHAAAPVIGIMKGLTDPVVAC